MQSVFFHFVSGQLQQQTFFKQMFSLIASNIVVAHVEVSSDIQWSLWANAGGLFSCLQPGNSTRRDREAEDELNIAALGNHD